MSWDSAAPSDLVPVDTAIETQQAITRAPALRPHLGMLISFARSPGMIRLPTSGPKPNHQEPPFVNRPFLRFPANDASDICAGAGAAAPGSAAPRIRAGPGLPAPGGGLGRGDAPSAGRALSTAPASISCR